MARYKYTRINGVLRPKHCVIWEQAHGPIPPGYVIHHRDGNGNNNSLENLQLLTKSEHIALHHQLRREGNDPVDPTDPNVIRERETARANYAAHKTEHNQRSHDWYVKNKEKASADAKLYRDAHKSEIAAYQKQYRATHKEEIAKTVKLYADTHKEQIAAMRKTYRETHRQEISENYAAYHKAHRQEKISYLRDYYAANREKLLEQKREYTKTHRDLILSGSRLRRAIKSGKPKELIDRLRAEHEKIKQAHAKK